MEKNRITNWLKMALVIGCLVDLCMVIIFIIPFLRMTIFGENPQVDTP